MIPRPKPYHYLLLALLLPITSSAIPTVADPASGAFAESASDSSGIELKQIGASDQPDFLRDGSARLRAIWYSRERTSPDKQRILADINVNVLGLGLDLSSGYWRNIIGVDLGLANNFKIGGSSGQSEILNYDYVKQHESSTLIFERASLKLKLGDEDKGFKANVGYTPIDVGTIGTASGLHTQGYRGFEAKYMLHDFEFGYGWADQFRNEWDNGFYRDITNSYFQNRAPFQGTADQITYIHTVGARYKFGPKKENFIDTGVGQSRGYRTNQQIAASYNFNLAEGHLLNLVAYYFQGQYNTELSGIVNPTNEWYTSVGGKYTHGPLTLFSGYSHSYAPDSNELNFRLTPYANSDNRNFIQTAAQLDDFVWDGEHVVKLGINYEIGTHFGLPGLATGASYNIGWGLVNKNAAMNIIGTSRLNETDVNLTYKVAQGKLKGFGAGVYLAWLQGDNDFYGKPPRNDVKFILSYEYQLL